MGVGLTVRRIGRRHAHRVGAGHASGADAGRNGPSPRLKKRHVQRETRLPTKRMATACWAFIVVKRPAGETASLLGFGDVARPQHEKSSTSYAQAGASAL